MVRKLVVTRIVGMVRLVTDPLRNLLFRLLGRTPPRRNVDMVARMLRSKFAKDVDFPLTRVGINAGGLPIGAIETTSQAVAQVVEFFIDRPNLLATAKDAARQGDAGAFEDRKSTRLYHRYHFSTLIPSFA